MFQISLFLAFFIRSAHRRKFERFGYVEYENETDAQKALDSMHDSVIDGSRIRVDFAGPAAPRFVPTPTSTVYMGNLPQTLSGDELQDLLFEEFGDQIGIREIRLLAPRADSQGGGMSGFLSPSNQENFKNRGFGFIQFDSVDQSTQFLESVQAKMTGGWTFQGNVLRIGYEREKPPQRSMGGSPDRFGGGGGGNGGYNDRRAGGGMGDRNTYGSEGRERREFGGGRPTFGRQAGRRNSDY